jgi:hypothetical protein
LVLLPVLLYKQRDCAGAPKGQADPQRDQARHEGRQPDIFEKLHRKILAGLLYG